MNALLSAALRPQRSGACVSRAVIYRYLNRVEVRSANGGLSGYFRGCTAYLDNGHFTVLLLHHCNPRLLRPFAVVALDSATIETDDPQDYEGFVLSH
jgi:hypothetical protein